MGRVRRYKKFKSCDPFAKKSITKVVDITHDEPIEIFENSVKKAEKRIIQRFESAGSLEKMIQREGARQAKLDDIAKLNKKAKHMEGRKEDETMKEFKTRIREETRTALRNEVKKITATAQKKKKFLEDKKFKKKGAARFDVDEELIEEGFSSRYDGFLRQSDLGGRDEFATAERIGFGERMDRPPDFIGVGPLRLKQGNNYVAKRAPSNKMHNPIDTTAAKEANAVAKSAAAKAWAEYNMKNNWDGSDAEEEEEERPKKKAKRSKISICDVVGGENGDDCGNTHRMQGGITYTNSKTKSNTSVKDLDKARKEAQEAYRALREKKRKF